MAENVKALRAAPVFGFEWNSCHYKAEGQSYFNRNFMKLFACVPIINFYYGGRMINWGVRLLSLSDQEAKENWGVDYQKTKAAAMIARGIATLFFTGLLFVLVDAAISAVRVAFRKGQATGNDNPDA